MYEAFIEGAKVASIPRITIIPYLVGMLVAIGVLRNSGVLGLIVSGFGGSLDKWESTPISQQHCQPH